MRPINIFYVFYTQFKTLTLLNKSVTYVTIPRSKDWKLTGHIPKHHILMHLKGYIYWIIYCGYIPMGYNLKNFSSLH